MGRKISAIIISIILSIVGIIPTMSITYAVNDNTVEEICIYRTSGTKSWHCRAPYPLEDNFWEFTSNLSAFNNGHVHIDFICLKCPGIEEYKKISYTRIATVSFDTTYVAPIGKEGFSGISTFTPSNKYSSFIEPVHLAYPGEYYVYYSNLDASYNSENDLTNKVIMSFDLYVKEHYLDRDLRICGADIPFSQHTIIKTEDYTLGDVNNDGTVDGSDATIVLREFGNVLAGKGESFTPEQFKAGDINGNNVLDGTDATYILKFYGEASKDKEISYGGMELWLQSLHYRNDSAN